MHLWSAGEIDHTTFVISGIDQCEEAYEWFLEDLVATTNNCEGPFKVVITSTARQEVLSGCQIIDLDDHKPDTGAIKMELSNLVDFELAQLVPNRPQYRGFEDKLKDLLLEINKEFTNAHLILDWLKFSELPKTKSAVKQRLQSLSLATEEDIIMAIMASIPTERQDWARKLITWVTYSLRALTICELQEVLLDPKAKSSEVDGDIIQPDLMTQIRESFGSIFIVIHNEVLFSHASLRDFFKRSDPAVNAWYRVKSPMEAHEELAISCLGYLSSFEGLRQATRFCDLNSDPEHPPYSNLRFNLLQYATMNWATHCSHALSTDSTSQDLAAEVDRFLHQDEIRDNWAKVHNTLSNPITRPEEPLSSPLVILSALGLRSLLAQKTANHEQTEGAAKDYALALVEACRGGHLEIISDLLSCFTPTKSTLDLAIAAADGAALLKIIESATELLEDFEFPPTLLCRAAWLGETAAVDFLLKRGVEVDPKEPLFGMSPLHLAARMGHVEVSKLLITAKADVNFLSLFDITPLANVAPLGHVEIVKLIIDAKADVNLKDESGWSVLQNSVNRGMHTMVKLLLDAGIDKNYPSDESYTLIQAAWKDFPKCCKALLEAGADTSMPNDTRPPLWWAANIGLVSICRLLLEYGADPNWKSTAHAPILIQAVNESKVELVELLLDKGADIDAQDESVFYHPTVLSCAAQNTSTEVVECLLKRGANIEKEGTDGITAVYYASLNDHVDITRLLVEAGANVNIITTQGWGPLHSAYNFLATARYLLQKGADVNRPCIEGTPLYMACKWNSPETVKLMLEHKPDLEIGFKGSDSSGFYEGMTPLFVALAHGYTDVVRLLLEAGSNVNHVNRMTPRKDFPLQHGFKPVSTDSTDEEPLRTLLEYRPELNMIDNKGDTALHLIHADTPVSFVKLLVNAGADIEIHNKNMRTALGEAAICANYDVVEYLLSKNAQVNLTGGNYGGPLHIACSLGRLSLVKLLLEHDGTNINLVDTGITGTPLQCACFARLADDIDDDSKHALVLYLLDEAGADVNTHGGELGHALNAAALNGPSELLRLLLLRKADPEFEDQLGRRALHLAALRTSEHVDLFTDDKLLAAEDKLKRLPLHYAVVSGRADLVKLVLDRTEGALGPEVVNHPDIDGWTPLMWALRICGLWGAVTEGQNEVIELLISRGADLWSRGEGLDRDWTPLKIARYYGASDETQELLTPKSDERCKDGESWDAKSHASKKANVHTNAYCNCCLLVSLRPTPHSLPPLHPSKFNPILFLRP
ncbi:ankyrin repeat-containing domain protein [Amylocarpus encephaloides]|uniref:Ankyrin repeat-containing domain protein n=1 Tax=Amylocarpus encephaloides TaxID=45428 RepID=A0A9P8C9R5_9HELO|nr:ankyrin repeat-containing domain protein [Amylocarpus encephaloides]